MTTAREDRSRDFYTRHGTAIIVCFALTLPLCTWGGLGAVATNSNDLSQWLTPAFQETQELNWFADRFGAEEVVVVSWPGCTLDSACLDRAAARFTGKPGKTGAGERAALFQHATSGRDLLRQLTSPPLDLSRREALRRLRGTVVGPDRQSTCLLLTLSTAGSQNPIVAIEQIAEVVRAECGLSSDELHMAGSAVENVALNKETDRLLLQFAFISGAVALLLAWWCLRSVRFVLILFAAAMVVTEYGLSIVYFSGGQMNSMLMLLPALWFALSVSAGVHLINYYREAVCAAGLQGAAQRAVAAAWLPCMLATATTAIGLGSLMVSDIRPVHMFGLYSALGLVAGLAILLLLVPSLLQKWSPYLVVCPSRLDGLDATAGLPGSAGNTVGQANRGARELDLDRPLDHAKDAERGHVPPPLRGPTARQWSALTVILARRRAVVLTLGLAATVLIGLGLVRLHTSSKLKDYFRRSSRLFADYAWLEQNVGPLIPVEIVVRFDAHSTLSFLDRMMLIARIEKAAASAPGPVRSLSAATFMPKLPSDRGLREGMRRALLKRRLERQREQLLKSGYVVADGQEEIWRVSVRVDATGATQYGPFVDQLRQRVERILREEHSAGNTAVRATYTGAVPMVARIQSELWSSLFKSFWLAMALISLVMILVLGSVSLGLLSMVPNLFPLVFVFGVMGWSHMPLDIGAMMTGSIALGIAVDDTFHFLIWFRRGRRGGMSLVRAIRAAYTRCGLAMIHTSVICGGSMLVYLGAGFVPAARFGGLMCALLVAALIGDLILLPALLVNRPRTARW